MKKHVCLEIKGNNSVVFGRFFANFFSGNFMGLPFQKQWYPTSKMKGGGFGDERFSIPKTDLEFISFEETDFKDNFSHTFFVNILE